MITKLKLLVGLFPHYVSAENVIFCQERLASLTGLQNQYTGYSINLAGGCITLLAMAFPFNLIDILPVCLFPPVIHCISTENLNPVPRVHKLIHFIDRWTNISQLQTQTRPTDQQTDRSPDLSHTHTLDGRP